jgi:hypothetical protein
MVVLKVTEPLDYLPLLGENLQIHRGSRLLDLTSHFTAQARIFGSWLILRTTPISLG